MQSASLFGTRFRTDKVAKKPGSSEVPVKDPYLVGRRMPGIVPTIAIQIESQPLQHRLTLRMPTLACERLQFSVVSFDE